MDKVATVRWHGNAQRGEIGMHYAMLLIMDGPFSMERIEKAMHPFEDVYSDGERPDDRRFDTYDGTSDFWYNSNGMWDWYTIGGRFRCRIPARSGLRTTYNEAFSGSSTYNERNDNQDLYDMALVRDIYVDEIDPDSWFHVLLPDGSWHEYSSYEWVDDSAHEVFNPEWDDFAGNFIIPYMDCTAICIDVHR